MTNLRAADGTQITVGTRIPPYRACPTTVQLFRFSAVTWNAHRIHYDRPYAQIEGYPDVLVHSHLHGCFLARAALEWASDGARLHAFRWENRGIAVAGDQLTVTGVVTAVAHRDGGPTVELDLEEHNQEGVLCAPGHAVLTLPSPGGAS